MQGGTRLSPLLPIRDQRRVYRVGRDDVGPWAHENGNPSLLTGIHEPMLG